MKNSNLKKKVLSNKLTPTIFSLIFAFSSIFFMPDGVSSQLRHGLTLPVVPFQKASAFAVNNVSAFWKMMFSFWNKGNEKETLKNELLNLKNLVLKQSNIIFKLKNEIRSLSDYYDRDADSAKPVTADIIGYDTLVFKKSITLDVGTKHGISVNDTVVFGNALIGRISSVAKYTSRVQLITDTDSRIPVRILETRAQGIVKGTSGSICRVEYVPDTVIVKKGERIVTSGVGGGYPDSILIGFVTKSEKTDGQLFLDITIRPIVDVSNIESVLVIRHIKTIGNQKD